MTARGEAVVATARSARLVRYIVDGPLACVGIHAHDVLHCVQYQSNFHTPGWGQAQIGLSCKQRQGRKRGTNPRTSPSPSIASPPDEPHLLENKFRRRSRDINSFERAALLQNL